MGSNWGRQLRWGSSQDHFERLQGPSQREGHKHGARKNIGGRQQLRQTRQTGRSKMEKKEIDYYVIFHYSMMTRCFFMISLVSAVFEPMGTNQL